MTTTERRALVLADGPDRVQRFLPALGRAAFQVRWAHHPAEAQRMVRESPIDLLVVALPLRGAETALAALRLRGCASRRAGAVILGEGEWQGDELALGRMANRMLRPDCDVEEFEGAVEAVLHSAPRVDLRPDARPRLTLGEGVEPLEVENLSASGMLVRGRSGLRPGAAFEFALELPDHYEIVRGRAEIVRVARRSESFAARFVALAADGATSLRAFVERERAGAGAPASVEPAPISVASRPGAAAREGEPELATLLPRLLTRRLGFGGSLDAAELGLEPMRAHSTLLESAGGEATTRPAIRPR